MIVIAAPVHRFRAAPLPERPRLSRSMFGPFPRSRERAPAPHQVVALEENVKEFGITYFGLKDNRQGIVHIIGPEQGFTLPGCTTVCGDSHTATHGAFGSLAFGIGTSEARRPASPPAHTPRGGSRHCPPPDPLPSPTLQVEHVLATQTLLQKRPKNMLIRIDGKLSAGVTSKASVPLSAHQRAAASAARPLSALPLAPQPPPQRRMELNSDRRSSAPPLRSLALSHRISSSTSSASSALRAAPAPSSSSPATPSSRSPWRGACPSATWPSRPARARAWWRRTTSLSSTSRAARSPRRRVL